MSMMMSWRATRSAALLCLSLAACANSGMEDPDGTGGGEEKGGSTGGLGGAAGSAAGGRGGTSVGRGGASGSTALGGVAGGHAGVGSGGSLGQGGSVGAGGAIPAGGRGGADAAGAGGNAGTAGAVARGGAGGTAGSAGLGGSSGAGGARAGAGGGAAGAGGSGGAAALGPCDIYGSGNTPCVAAHSTVRALYGAFNGNLYQVKRASDGTTKDVGVLTAGGFANAATQDTFCANTTCKISIIYDQSPKANHLTPAPAGGAGKTPDDPADAKALKVMVGGHAVYGVHIPAGVGYRNNRTSGIATGDQPETEYMITSGTYYNAGCCFDYGNAETTNNDDGNGTMEAIYFGNCVGWGKGSGSGPWVMADLENGLFAGQTFAANPTNTSLTHPYVTALVKGRAGTFAIKGGDAQAGTLATLYDGGRPSGGYNPMKKQGAIILGIGGDNSKAAQGNFFEGVMTAGASSDAVDNAVQANIVAAGYGR
jgi:hypothetical protein